MTGGESVAPRGYLRVDYPSEDPLSSSQTNGTFGEALIHARIETSQKGFTRGLWWSKAIPDGVGQLKHSILLGLDPVSIALIILHREGLPVRQAFLLGHIVRRVRR